jgi:hypothetical protein
MNSNIQLTPTLESNIQISFLDLIIRKSHQLEIDVYRKPTATDTTINYLLIKSPNETQTSRLHILNRRDAKRLSQPHPPTQGMANHTSHSHIQQLPITLLHKLKQQIQHKISNPPPTKNSENNTKWAIFTFFSPHVRKITNLFKHTNPKIGFGCFNTIPQLTKPAADHIPPHNKGGVYQLTCKTCNLSYVGQTSRKLKTRLQEHIRHIKTNNPQSAYAEHILHNRHEYGTLNELMILLKPFQHENMLLPYEQYHIQSLHQVGKLIPEQCPGELNPPFQLAFNSQPPHTTQDIDRRAASHKPDT